MVRPEGIEPPLPVPKTGALSVELQAQRMKNAALICDDPDA